MMQTNPSSRFATHKEVDTGIELKSVQPKQSSGEGSDADAPLSNSKNPTKAQRLRAHVQFATLCWTLYVAGWNDGSTGPLLPRIQKFYDVNFTVVSLLFVLACIGFLAGALSNLALDGKCGFGKVILLGSLFQVVAYSINAVAPPFPVFVLCFTINGIGMALQDAQANGFVASLRNNQETKMGILHMAYGAGALSSPLVATQFAQLPHWSFHYLCSLGIASLNTILLFGVFRLKNQDDCLAEIGVPLREKANIQSNQFRQVFTLRSVHLLALFLFAYVGVEVTVGGWIVTYILNIRHGGPSAGYISSGFFGGLMFGRVGLLWVNRKIGERRAPFVYALLAIGFELMVWFVPSLVGDAVAVAIVGIFLGPMYPIAMNHAARVLPPWLLTSSIGWIAGCGQAGSALLPFITGAIASKSGIKTLHPILVSMMVFMAFLWALVPGRARREG